MECVTFPVACSVAHHPTPGGTQLAQPFPLSPLHQTRVIATAHAKCSPAQTVTRNPTRPASPVGHRFNFVVPDTREILRRGVLFTGVSEDVFARAMTGAHECRCARVCAVCARVCACARARACVCVRARARLRVCARARALLLVHTHPHTLATARVLPLRTLRACAPSPPPSIPICACLLRHPRYPRAC